MKQGTTIAGQEIHGDTINIALKIIDVRKTEHIDEQMIGNNSLIEWSNDTVNNTRSI